MAIKIICAKCNIEMEKSILDSYEYIDGIPLHNVECYQCPKCKQITFTEEQTDRMEYMSQQIRMHLFAFERKVTYSGKSLAITIPEDLATHLNLQKGKPVKILPIDKKGFLVQVKK